jgi:hypothetical protein
LMFVCANVVLLGWADLPGRTGFRIERA